MEGIINAHDYKNQLLQIFPICQTLNDIILFNTIVLHQVSNETTILSKITFWNSYAWSSIRHQYTNKVMMSTLHITAWTCFPSGRTGSVHVHYGWWFLGLHPVNQRRGYSLMTSLVWWQDKLSTSDHVPPTATKVFFFKIHTVYNTAYTS